MMAMEKRIDLLENESSELADKLIQVIIGGQYEIMMVVIVMMEMMLMMEMILMMVIEKRIDLLENESNKLADKLIQVNLLLMVMVMMMMLVMMVILMVVMAQW